MSWTNKVGGVLSQIGQVVSPQEDPTQIPTDVPTTRAPIYEKAADIEMRKREQGLEQQKIDVEKMKAGAMVNFYKIRDQEALAKIGSKRDEMGEIVPDPQSVAYRRQQAQAGHYEDLKAHYGDQQTLGLLKDQLGRETLEVNKSKIRAQMSMLQQRMNQRNANLARQWAAQEYAETGIINPQAQQVFSQGGYAPGGQVPAPAAAQTPAPQATRPASARPAPTATPVTPPATPVQGSNAVSLFPGQEAPIPPPGARAQVRMITKPLEKAVTGDQSYALLKESYERVQKTGVIKGNDAMMALGAHVGSSIGQIPGVRIGRDTLEAHHQARSLPEDVEALYNRVTSGGTISRDQLQQWWNTAQTARSQRWQGALKEAAGVGGKAIDAIDRAMPRGIPMQMTFPDGKTYPIASERATEMIKNYGAKPL